MRRAWGEVLYLVFLILLTGFVLLLLLYGILWALEGIWEVLL